MPLPHPSPPVGTLASVSLDCLDPAVLADSWAALLGLERVYETPDGSLVSLSGTGGPHLTMMRADTVTPPSWPDGTQQQLHLDVAVRDLAPAVAVALALGATQAAVQPAPQVWRVLLDPAGHPFCLTTVAGD